MLSPNIIFKNFKIKNTSPNQKKKLLKDLKNLLNEKNHILSSLNSDYKSSYNKDLIFKLKKFKNFKLIGIGGSILGAKAIYNFLSPKIKNFFALIIFHIAQKK